MTKKLLSILFAAVLCLALILPASAAVTDNPRVVDMADLLTDEEEADLNAKLNAYSTEQNCDIVCVTTPDLNNADFSFNGTVIDYADIYYESHGYDQDGVLVLITLENEYGNRNITFSCSGKCMKRLTDDEQNEILDDVFYTLQNSQYYAALNSILYQVNDKLTPQLKWYMLPLAIGVGFALAIIIMVAVRSKLKSVTMQRGAAGYVRPGSMQLTASRDTYLYSTVSRTEKPKDNGGSGRTSSGGGSHSGVSRDF